MGTSPPVGAIPRDIPFRDDYDLYQNQQVNEAAPN
jgi:hypothetical protein